MRKGRINIVTGRQNQRLKLLRRLENRKHREKEGLFLAEGIRFVEEALSSGWPVEFLACTEKTAVSPRGELLLQSARSGNIPVLEVDEKLFAGLSDTITPQGVLAVVRQKRQDCTDLIFSGRVPLLLIVDGVQDPGNLGTIVRTADAAGAGGVLLLKGTVDLYNPKVLRSTMGSIFHVPIVQNLETNQALDVLAAAGAKLFAGLPRAARSLYEVDLRGPAAFLLGSEARGPGNLAGLNVESISIPLPGRAESLNVAVAAGVLLFEALRQRRFHK
ncbi:MAG: TrmH family RNA methyltransferase [Eubacteriales bacterium]